MEKKKEKIKHPAVHMKKRQAKKLAMLKHCCIPSTIVKTETVEYEDGTTRVVNPDIKPNGNGTFNSAGTYYKELKAKRLDYLKTNYKYRKKQPWYMLTRGKCYNNSHQKVESEYSKLYKLTIIPKFAIEECIIQLLCTMISQWEKEHPKPNKNDLFYSQEINKWIDDYETAFDNCVVNAVRFYKKEARSMAPISATMFALSNTKITNVIERERNKYVFEKQPEEKKTA